MNINDILTITLTLFAVVDILGSLPLIISIRQKTGHINSLKATIVAFFIMMAFLFISYILFTKHESFNTRKFK